MALNPFQKAIEQLAKSQGLRGQDQQRVYQTPEFQNLITQFFGNIQLPPGIDESKVVSRTPTTVEYMDDQGYIHRLERDISGVSPKLGQVSETSSNRPSILPLDQGNNPVAPTPQVQQNLTQTLTQALTNPVSLTQLDQNTLGQLQGIFNAQNAIQEDQFKRAQGTAIAQLVGRGVGASSIAGDVLNQLLQGQGLVRGQQQANQNQTQLGLQQFLTSANQQNKQDLQGFIQNLLQLSTQRDVAGGNLDLGKLQATNQNNQFYAQLQEQIRQFDEQLRQQQRQSLIDNIFKGVATATGIGSGLSGLFSGGGGGSVPAPPIPSYFPSSTYQLNSAFSPRP